MKNIPAEKGTSIICILLAFYFAFDSIIFLRTVLPMTQGADGVGTLLLIASFITPVAFLLMGILGLARKLKAAIVFAAIGLIVGIFSLVSILTSGVFEWDVIPAVGIPIFLIVESSIALKRE